MWWLNLPKWAGSAVFVASILVSPFVVQLNCVTIVEISSLVGCLVFNVHLWLFCIG